MEAPHPYVPRDLKLDDYVPVSLSMSAILTVFFLSALFIVSLAWLVSGRCRVSKVDRFLMCWWLLTALIHIVVEGYFVFSPKFFKDKTSFYLAEVWKEYSKGDSRYAARDAGVVAVEGITAVLEGPAALLVVYAIAKGKSYSYILQFVVSIGQLYGVLVYYITAILEGDNFATNSFYYYAYYIGANASWIVVPLIIAIRCWNKICATSTVQPQPQRKNKTKAR